MTIEFREPIDRLGEICVDFDLEPAEVEAFSDWLIRQNGNFIKGTVMLESLTKYLVVNGYLEIDEKWADGINEFREGPREVDPPEPKPEPESEDVDVAEDEPKEEPDDEDDVPEEDEDDDDDGFPPLKTPPRSPRTPQPIRKRRNED